MYSEAYKVLIVYVQATIFLGVLTEVRAQTHSLQFRPQLLCIDNNEACSIGDVNRDGLLDVVAGRLWYAAPNFVPRPLRTIGLHPPDYARNNGEHLYDVDADGWLDVVSTGWGKTVLEWFKNPGKDGLEKGLEWSNNILAETNFPHGEAGFLIDIDGDSTPEYVINSWIKTLPYSIWKFEEDEQGNPAMTQKYIGANNSHGTGFGDVNGDGRLDVLIDNGWYEQPADAWDGNWIFHESWDLEQGSCPFQVIDLNGDGRNDVIWGKGHDYGLYWLAQEIDSEGSEVWTKHLIDDSWSQIHALSLVDLNGDGKKELITGKRIWAHSGKDPGSNDPPALYAYTWDDISKSFDRQTIAEGNIGTGLFIRNADLNSDGRQDLVVSGKTGTYILWQE